METGARFFFFLSAYIINARGFGDVVEFILERRISPSPTCSGRIGQNKILPPRCSAVSWFLRIHIYASFSFISTAYSRRTTVRSLNVFRSRPLSRATEGGQDDGAPCARTVLRALIAGQGASLNLRYGFLFFFSRLRN